MTDAELIERLRDVGAKGWTVRGQVCAGDLMTEAADRLEAIANKLQRMEHAIYEARDVIRKLGGGDAILNEIDDLLNG